MQRIRSERGNALIETAITLPILLLVSVSIFEFGRAYQTWEVMTNAAREGARIAVLDGTTDAEIRARVNQYLGIGGLTSQPDGNISIDHTVSFTGDPTGPKGSLVQISYPFDFMVLNPVAKLVVSDSTLGSSIEMHASALMRNE
ncbi:MAG TPA: TadE/TadG family type IV pilus assembly protein [Vicinamibacterales bacterium]|jgi:Flp pilus assembly protein TadG|nr:TadE/TadG family type IV pilus assembly protein [Vicinamibacterales bacterium]